MVKKHKKKEVKKRRQRDTFEILIREKSKDFFKAIKDYWYERDKLENEFRKVAEVLGERKDIDKIFPSDFFKFINVIY